MFMITYLAVLSFNILPFKTFPVWVRIETQLRDLLGLSAKWLADK